jgi:hypothetical protein
MNETETIKKLIIEGKLEIISQEKKYPIKKEYINGKLVEMIDYDNPYYEVELVVRGKRKC